MSSEKLLHPAGGSTLRAGFPARSRSGVGGKGCGCCGEVRPVHAQNLPKAPRSSWMSTGLSVDSGVNAEGTEFGSPSALQVVRRQRFKLLERLLDRFPQELCGVVRVGVG